jgi:hypothetical protein
VAPTWLLGLLTVGLLGSLESDMLSTRSFGIDMPGRLLPRLPPPSVSEPISDALVASSARMRSRSDFFCARARAPASEIDRGR